MGVTAARRPRSAPLAPRGLAGKVSAFHQRPLVYVVMCAYAVGSPALMATHQVGLTSEHAVLIGLVTVTLVARARPFVWEWLPFLLVAVMFEDLSSAAAHISSAVHTIGPIVFERSLLGGVVATTWLQHRLAQGLFVHWLNQALVAEYLFHFAAPLAAGAWLWGWHRDRFGRFVSVYFLVMAAGFVGYLLFPEMPPWLAAEHGWLPPVHRYVVETLQRMSGLGRLYAGAAPEPNAAMPSLHVAVPVAIAATAIAVRGRRRPTSWLWLLYPLTVSFGVLYLGEHYVADALAGAALGAVAFAAVEVAACVGLVGQGRRRCWSLRPPEVFRGRRPVTRTAATPSSPLRLPAATAEIGQTVDEPEVLRP